MLCALKFRHAHERKVGKRYYRPIDLILYRFLDLLSLSIQSKTSSLMHRRTVVKGAEESKEHVRDRSHQSGDFCPSAEPCRAFLVCIASDWVDPNLLDRVRISGPSLVDRRV